MLLQALENIRDTDVVLKPERVTAYSRRYNRLLSLLDGYMAELVRQDF